MLAKLQIISRFCLILPSVLIRFRTIDQIINYNKTCVEQKGYEKYITDKYPDKKLAVPIRKCGIVYRFPSQLRHRVNLNLPAVILDSLAKYGRFRNVTNYFVIAGKTADDLDERAGYYGEHLVLLAQTLGLNTCWVGLSYSKVPGTYVLEEGDSDSIENLDIQQIEIWHTEYSSKQKKPSVKS